MILKELVKDILQTYPETRNDYKKLIWRVWEEMGYVDRDFNYITFDKFMDAPQPECIRRPAQQIFREDRLLGKNEIQPARVIKEHRSELAKEKGYTFIQAKQPVFNPKTMAYEI